MCYLCLQDVFGKHGDLLKELGVNLNNGLGDLYDKIKGHPLQETVEKDLQVYPRGFWVQCVEK